MLGELFGSFAGQLSLLVIMAMIVTVFIAVKVLLKKMNENPEK